MPDIEHIALRLRKARLALDAINDRVQLTKDDPAPPVGGGQPAASSTTDDVHVAGLVEVARRKRRIEALAQKSAELLAKYNMQKSKPKAMPSLQPQTQFGKKQAPAFGLTTKARAL